MAEFTTYWGETHENTFQYDRQEPPLDVTVRAASDYLDFYSAAYYTSYSDSFSPGGHVFEKPGRQKLAVEEWKPAERIEREWAIVQEVTRQLNADGRFVTFPGYEWQGDGRDGDHNVIGRTEGLPVFRVNRLEELYAALRGRQALAIPHHTAYRRGVRGHDWDLYDEVLSPFSEIYSVHGCSETDEELIGLRINASMGPGVAGGTYQDGLNRGHHLGAVASTDGWGGMAGQYGRGLAAVLATDLTREAIWDAFTRRRVYAVTGDRIELDFTVNGRPMGSIIGAAPKRAVRVRVRGSDAIDRIELLRNQRVIATHCHQGTWRMPAAGQVGGFKIRVEAGWGPRPGQLDGLQRQWSGRVELDGGRLVGYEPCWVSLGQTVPRIDGRSATFGFLSTGDAAAGSCQNATVFELEATPETVLAIELNGLSERGSVGEFCGGSRVMWFRDDCVAMLKQHCDLDPSACERGDIFHHVAYKAKLHRAIPEAGYCASLDVEDDESLVGECHYRVRVEQRNGQRAWSSPIWVSPSRDDDAQG